MRQFQLLGILLMPSLFSFIGGAVLASFLLLIINAPLLLTSKLVGGMLGAEGSQLSMLFNHMSGMMNTDQPQVDLSFLDLPIIYNITILAAAIIAGVLVYISLESITRSVRGVRDSIAGIQFAKDAKVRTALGIEFGARLALRLGSVTGWAAYIAFWLGVVLPYCVLVSRIGLGESDTMTASFYIFSSLLLLCLSLHLHVIFLRLFLLRPRLFAG